MDSLVRDVVHTRGKLRMGACQQGKPVHMRMQVHGDDRRAMHTHDLTKELPCQQASAFSKIEYMPLTLLDKCT